MPGLRRLAARGRGAAEAAAVAAPLALLDVLRDGAVPVNGAGPGRAEASRLRIAVVVPSFRRGSGGHKTIADLVRGLEARGHGVAVFVDDVEGRHAAESPELVASSFAEFFGPTRAQVIKGLASWPGADVVVATGWQTVPTVLRLGDAGARAYLVQDHEPEFYGTSAERLWAEWTYAQGLHCVCASPWLAEVVTDRYGASASEFDLGVDHRAYKPLPTHRRDDLVLFYARGVTARRGVPLGVLALTELKRRRPGVEIGLFGQEDVGVPFDALQLGVMAPDDLAHAYASAAVGLCLSLTNPSLIPTEMMACGLPVVDVASPSMTATFGPGFGAGAAGEGVAVLAEPSPLAICDAVEGLLDDLVGRAELSRAGAAFAAERTWPRAAEQVEAGLRAALRAADGPDA